MLRARGVEDRLRDQRGRPVAGAVSPGGRAAAGRGALGHRSRLRSRGSARAAARSSGTATSTRRIAPSSRRAASRWSSCAPQPDGLRVPLQTRHRKHADPDAQGNPRGFATPSRKVELWSETFLDHGYAALPDFVEPQIGPATRPDLAARFPLVLTCAKPTLFCQTQHRALPSLRGARRIRRSSCIPMRRQRAASRPAAGSRSKRRPAACGRARGSTTSSIRAWSSASTAGGKPATRWERPATIRSATTAPTSIGPSMPRSAIPISGTPAHRANLCEVRPSAPAA